MANSDGLHGAMSVDQFCADYAVGRTRFYELVNGGVLKARKNGKRTVVRREDAEAWASSLPELKSAAIR